MSHDLCSILCVLTCRAVVFEAIQRWYRRSHVNNPSITPSVPLRDSILQGRVCDKEPLSRGHFGHQKRDDVISDRSVVSLFLSDWFPQKTNLLKSPCPGGPLQTHTVCKKQYGMQTAACSYLHFDLPHIKAGFIKATMYHGCQGWPSVLLMISSSTGSDLRAWLKCSEWIRCDANCEAFRNKEDIMYCAKLLCSLLLTYYFLSGTVKVT